MSCLHINSTLPRCPDHRYFIHCSSCTFHWWMSESFSDPRSQTQIPPFDLPHWDWGQWFPSCTWLCFSGLSHMTYHSNSLSHTIISLYLSQQTKYDISSLFYTVRFTDGATVFVVVSPYIDLTQLTWKKCCLCTTSLISKCTTYISVDKYLLAHHLLRLSSIWAG